jgi:hypothetical protein
MKYKILAEEEISSILNDYYNNKLTIKQCVFKYNSSKSTIINLLKKRGYGGRKRESYNNNKYECDESFFEKIDSHEKAYWFGFIAADGNIYNQKLQIGLNKKDENHLLKFCQRIKYSGPLYNDRSMKKLMICRKKIVKDLKNLGLIENKTYSIDGCIFDKIPSAFEKSAILGYIDGDGSFSVIKKTGITRFSIVGNEPFLLYLSKFFDKNGLKMSCPKKDKRTVQTFYSSIHLCGDRLDIFLDCIYGGSEDFLKRKRDKL